MIKKEQIEAKIIDIVKSDESNGISLKADYRFRGSSIMLLYILLTIIAIGVLLASEPGRVLLVIILAVGFACFVLYVGFYLVLFLLAIFFEYKNKFPPIFTIESEYNWILGAIFGVIILGAAVYKALYPLGYEKNRQIWTGKMKADKSNKINAEEELINKT